MTSYPQESLSIKPVRQTTNMTHKKSIFIVKGVNISNMVCDSLEDRTPEKPMRTH